jgi:hypothetical protein
VDIYRVGDIYLITGQIALSMPEQPCLKCLGLLPHCLLKEESEKYGNAGSRPQVILPNATLASTAVSFFIQVITPWFKNSPFLRYWNYDGNRQTVQKSSKKPHPGRMGLLK